MATSEPTKKQVLEWLEAVQHELDDLFERIQPLLEEQRRLETRQALLKDLLSSFGPIEETGTNGVHLPIRQNHSVADYVRDAARGILRDAGGLMHINDLHAEFIRRGSHVPGAGRPVNLIVHLRGAPGIVSPERGMYGLEEVVGPVPTTKRKSRVRGRPRKRR